MLAGIQVILENPNQRNEDEQHSVNLTKYALNLIKDPQNFRLGNIFMSPSKFNYDFVLFVQSMIEFVHTLNMKDVRTPEWMRSMIDGFDAA